MMIKCEEEEEEDCDQKGTTTICTKMERQKTKMGCRVIDFNQRNLVHFMISSQFVKLGLVTFNSNMEECWKVIKSQSLIL